MHPSLIPPRQVKIGDAAAFVGTTPRAIRHYHEVGLLPEPDRGSDGRRRYGYDEMIRLLWIRTMVDAGIALPDIRDAVIDSVPDGTASDQSVAVMLERLEESLDAQVAELQRQRTVVQRMRTRGSRVGLLPEFVASRLDGLPEGSLRQADLDNLLLIERILGPLGAAVNASRYIALATHRELREESDRIDAAEEALDDTVAVDDPRVANVAAERHAFEERVHAVIDEAGGARSGDLPGDDVLVESWEALHPATDGGRGDEDGRRSVGEAGLQSAAEAIARMPYDFSPARIRCLELVVEMTAPEPPAR